MLIASKLRATGWCGVVALMLSMLIIGGTFGFSWLVLCVYVLGVALRSSSRDVIGSRYLVVPGVRLVGNKAGKEFESRLDRALALIKAYAQSEMPNICILGGVTEGNQISEAQVGALYLQGRGVPESHLFQEALSNNTLENFHFLKAIIPLCEDITIVTSRYHLARCRAVASSLGYQGYLVAAEDRFAFSWKNLMRVLLESFNLHWYFCRRFCGLPAK